MLLELLTKRYPGMRFWLMQRIAAVVMAMYIPLAILYFVIEMPSTYADWLAFNQPLWWRFLSCISMLSLCLHAWIGVRDVFRDYVQNQQLRDGLLAAVEVSLLVYWVWVVIMFWSI